MATFSKLGVWPVGYFRAYSGWLLRNRRDVARRIEVLNAEIDRIGVIRVEYAQEERDGNVRRTEQRVGLSVTQGSTLGRLLRAYVAAGGDPLAISPFMYPETNRVIQKGTETRDKIEEEYPHGGVVAPMSASPVDPLPSDDYSGYEGHPGGYLRSDSYYPARQGGRIDPGAYDHGTVAKTLHQMRAWANQDLKERLQDLEWRILKQCDLREQLVQERDDVLVQAFGGALIGLPAFEESRFNRDMQVQNLVQEMNQILYQMDGSGGLVSEAPNAETALLQFTFPDAASEVGRDMLG